MDNAMNDRISKHMFGNLLSVSYEVRVADLLQFDHLVEQLIKQMIDL